MRAAILVQTPISLFELGYAVELFALPANRYDQWYETQVITFAGGMQQGIAGVELNVSRVVDLDPYQLVIIPAWSIQHSVLSEPLAEAITNHFFRGGRLLTFCTGAFLLAELGLLNGRQATTHWAYAENFRQRYPKVNYVEDVLYLYDGKIGCSAGSAAGIDLSLEVIRQDYGYRIANQVARRLVMSPHRSGGQSQFVETPILKTPNRFANAIDWAISHLAEKITVAQMAEQAVMSRRSFDRKFKAAFNLSPQQWLIRQRLGKTKELLENTELTIEQIAILVGFDNAMTMRHHFRKFYTLSPSQFRQQFGQKSSGLSC